MFGAFKVVWMATITAPMQSAALQPVVFIVE